MNRNASVRRNSNILTFVAMSLSTVSLAAQSPTFSLQVLNNLSGVEGAGAVSGINNAGEAVGGTGGAPGCGVSGCAVIWRNATPTRLGVVAGELESEARGINNVGQIIGYVSITENVFQAVIWNNGTPALLPAPGSQYVQTMAASINDAGQVAGGAMTAYDAESVAVVWNGLIPTTLRADINCQNEGYATGINNAGLVVGGEACIYSVPVYWVGINATPLQVHPTTPPGGASDGSASAVNDLGVIVGFSNDAENPSSAPIAATAWANGTVTNLGPFPAIQGDSYATAVNNRGVLVGQSAFNVFLYHAAVWSLNGAAPLDLNNLIDPVLAEKYVLTDATGINDSCTIVANGTNKKTLGHEAFLLKLTDPSMCGTRL